MKQRSKPLRIAVGYRARLRNGEIVRISDKRHAPSLDGSTKELVWCGSFKDGGLCAWWPNGVYRGCSFPQLHPLDIVEAILTPWPRV